MIPIVPSDVRAAETAVVRGNIEKFTMDPAGKINGAVLDNDNETILMWTPNLQDQFNPLLKLADRVRATGRKVPQPAAEHRFAVESLTNLSTGQTVKDPGFERQPVAPGASRVPEITHIIVVRGRVEKFTAGQGGQTNGAVLDNDTEMVLRWPEKYQERFLAVMKPADRVRAIGRRARGPTGDNLVLVKSVTNLESGETAENPVYIGQPAKPERDNAKGSRPPAADREQRLRDLENRLEELRREIAELREENN